MRPSYGLQAVDVVKLGGNLVAEQPAGAARAHGPGVDVLGIAPYQVAEGALVRYLLGSRNDADLVNGPDFRTQPAMHTQDGAVDNGGEDEEVEDLATGLPDGRVTVLLLALFVEPVDLCDLS